MKLKGKVAIVTGSSRGIGKSIASWLGKEGVKVMINGRREERLANTQAYLRKEGMDVKSCVGDVSKPEDCRRLVEETLKEFGKIDILINNAGIGSRGFIEDTTPEVFKKIVDTNVMGSVYPTLAALPHIKEQKGDVIFISSVAGFRGIPNKAPYCMSKMAQTSFAETMHNELGPDGVHVGIVYVNATTNEPEKRVLQADGSWTVLRDRNGPLMDTREDVAKVVVSTLKKRHFKSIVGLKGKSYYMLQKLFPWIVDYTFQHRRNTIRALDT